VVIFSNTVLFCCSSCTEGGITAKKCEEILSEVFVGETHILKCFHHFLEGHGPSYDHSSQALQGAISFLENVKVMHISAPCLGYWLVSMVI
jgi:paired amphipathic helix protein Sin3a